VVENAYTICIFPIQHQWVELGVGSPVTLCPGGTDLYYAGPTRSYFQAPEGPYTATIEAYGIDSGTRVTATSQMAYSVKRG